MIDFTVEVTTGPVVDDGWTQLREVLDTVPGSVLIEDAEAPLLIMPVSAFSILGATTFVEGVAKIMGIEIVSGKVYPAPPVDEIDLDDDDSDLADTPVARRARTYADRIAEVEIPA